MRLGINISVSRQNGGFGPASLFSAGQAGVWYDPSDLNTLFQDVAGTTPVTAAGQPVGLMLDKSQGLTIGPQLVTGDNSTFTNGVGDWVTSGSFASTAVATGGELQVTVTASFGRQVLAVPTTAGRWYRVTGLARWVSGGGASTPMIGLSTANNGASANTQAIPQSTSFAPSSAVLQATGSQIWVTLGVNNVSTTGAVVAFDNILVSEVKGNHAAQATSGLRPLYQIDGTGKPYLSFDGVDDELTATTLNLSGVPYVAAVVGQRKERDTTIGTLLSHGTSTSTAGFWQIFAPRSDTNYGWRGFSSTPAAMDVTFGTLPQPDLAVITGLFDPAAAVGVQITGRRNGVQVVQGVSALQLAPFVSTSFTLGKRGSSDLPYLGRIYGVIVVGAATSAATVSSMESWMNSKTGAY